VDHVLENGFVSGTGRRPARDAGIGEDNVELPEILGQGCEEPLAVFCNSEVSAVATRIPPCAWAKDTELDCIDPRGPTLKSTAEDVNSRTA
jgi:hypothetical protein